jgi:hypothetical protein
MYLFDLHISGIVASSHHLRDFLYQLSIRKCADFILSCYHPNIVTSPSFHTLSILLTFAIKYGKTFNLAHTSRTEIPRFICKAISCEWSVHEGRCHISISFFILDNIPFQCKCRYSKWYAECYNWS